ncbi:hypothetical protein [Nonomuraea ceibae]|uniref:hypothetical protein n=1 Tax=Nonomuraea ceibae TaxID=1935170 RepID=UPI001FE33868|nr:hypothetical protein [Nonomuraea ceibae]
MTLYAANGTQLTKTTAAVPVTDPIVEVTEDPDRGLPAGGHHLSPAGAQAVEDRGDADPAVGVRRDVPGCGDQHRQPGDRPGRRRHGDHDQGPKLHPDRAAVIGIIPNTAAAYRKLSAHLAEARRRGDFPDLIDAVRKIHSP